MRSITTEELKKLKASGRSVKPGRVQKPSAPKKISKQDSISKAIRGIKIYDHSVLLAKSTEKVAEMLLKTSERLDKLTSNKVSKWDVSVTRGKNKLIKKIRMTAVR